MQAEEMITDLKAYVDSVGDQNNKCGNKLCASSENEARSCIGNCGSCNVLDCCDCRLCVCGNSGGCDCGGGDCGGCDCGDCGGCDCGGCGGCIIM